MKGTRSERAQASPFKESPVNTQDWGGNRIVVLIPCKDEETAIGAVVRDFRAVLPDAAVFVYDNCSTDRTAEVARAAGAIVRCERSPGKGNVVRRMFSDIEAEIYVLVDGDDTYDAYSAPKLVQHLLDNQLDMVNGSRISHSASAYRFGHEFGNRLLTSLVARIFGNRFTDMLSGYKVFSRRFVKSFPALSNGFEIETELTVHALELCMPMDEVETPYKERPENSESKLRTYSDGIRILKAIALLVKEERPFQFFSVLAVALAVASVILAWPIIDEYAVTGLVPRFPTVILCSALMILAFLSFACGLILDSVTLGRRELKRMIYLNNAGIAASHRKPV
jgi:hypothetical protein